MKLALKTISLYGAWFILFASPKSKVYSKEINVTNKIKYSKREDSEKYINLTAVSLDIKDKNKDIQTYFVDYNEDIEMAMKESVEKQIRQAEKVEARKSKKKKEDVNYLNKDNTIKSDNTVLSDQIFKTLKKTGFIDTVNKVFQDNNNKCCLCIYPNG